MKNLKLLRKNHDLSLKQLSENTGISPQMLSYYELGQSQPPIETIIQLSDYFDCSVDYLLGHETPGILHLDSFTEGQKKLIEIIKQLNEPQVSFLIGYCSDMLNLPYNSVKPVRPW